jgi:hypothetical protein
VSNVGTSAMSLHAGLKPWQLAESFIAHKILTFSASIFLLLAATVSTVKVIG